jgi:hypothetical protein
MTRKGKKMMRFHGDLRTLALLIGLATALSAMPAAHAGSVTGVSLTVDPAVHVGPCDPSGVRFSFTGKIRTDGPTRVQYRFLRSDGAISPVREFEARRAGSYGVTSTWTLGGRVAPDERWQLLEVLYPNAIASERAVFRLDCGVPAAESWTTFYRYEDGDGPGECRLSGSGEDAGHLEPGEIIQVEIRQSGYAFRGEGVLYEMNEAREGRIVFYVVAPSGRRFEFQGVYADGIETVGSAEGTYYRTDRPDLHHWWRIRPRS